MNKKVYIIGDYIQYEESKASAIFEDRAKELSAIGYDVINPQMIIHPGMSLREVLARCIPILLSSDCVSFIEHEYPQYKYVSDRAKIEEYIVNCLLYTSSKIEVLNNPLSGFKRSGLSIIDAINERPFSAIRTRDEYWYRQSTDSTYMPLFKYCIDKGYIPPCTKEHYEVYYSSGSNDEITSIQDFSDYYFDNPSEEVAKEVLSKISEDSLKYGEVVKVGDYLILPDYLPDYCYGYGDPRNNDEMVYSLRHYEYNLENDEANVIRPKVPIDGVGGSEIDYRTLIREHLFLLMACGRVREHPYNEVISNTQISDIENNIYLLDKNKLPTASDYLSEPGAQYRSDLDSKDFSLFGETADYLDEWEETDPRISPDFSIIDSIISFIVKETDLF